MKLRFVAAVACVAGRSVGPVPRILALPDKQMDGGTLTATMKAMGRAVDDGRVSQVIIQTVRRPADVPSGWTVIEL